MKRTSVFLLIILALFLLTSCRNETPNKVRIACFPNLTHAQALVGKSLGSFDNAFGEDVEVEWYTFSAGPSEIGALFAGDIDIGYIGPLPAINGYSKSYGDICIISGATGAGSLLVTRRGLILEDINQLDGRKIAVPQYGNTQDILLRDILSSVGLKDKNKGGTVEILACEISNTKLLLDRGEIDAAFVPEPWGTRLVEEIEANILLDYNEIYDGGEYPTAVVVARRDFMEKYPEKVEAFLREHIRLTNYINDNKDEACSIVIDEIKNITGNELSQEMTRKSLDRMFVTTMPYKKSVEKFTKAYDELGYMTVETDFSQLIDTSVLDKILSE